MEQGSEDEMVDVCEDEEDSYGPPEYTLSDLSTNTTTTPMDTETGRRMVVVVVLVVARNVMLCAVVIT